MELVLGGIAAVGAGCFTNPMDVVKIRMQLQGELKSKGKYAIHYRNVFHAAYTIARMDGILALQKGLTPALWYQFIMNGTRLGLYDWLSKRGLAKDKDGNVKFFRSALVASLSGGIGASVGSPFFLVKTHLQSLANESSIAVGHQHKHKRMTAAFKSIYSQHGIVGLYRGISSAIARVVVASSIQLSTFEKSLEFVRSSNISFIQSRWLSAFLASLVSGIFVSVGMAPFDLISTRFYNQGVNSQGKGELYNSVFDCGKKIYQKEGFRGFYKGWSANYFRIGPHTLLSLVFWDQLKYYHTLYELGQNKNN